MKSKKTTIYDIAKEANVSPASVSRVINHPSSVSEDLRKRIEEAMVRLDFDVQNSWHRNYVRSGAILVVYPSESAFLMDGYIRYLKSNASKDNRIIILLALTGDSSAQNAFEEALATYQPIGVFAFYCSGYSFFENKNWNIPLIFVCDVPEGTDHPCVDYDWTAIMRRGIDHLKNRGCKNIVYLSHPRSLPCADKQLTGVIDAMREKRLYTTTNIITLNETSYDFTYETVGNILSRRYKPDAVFCSNDYLAMHFMQIAAKADITAPGDILVLGVGGYEITKYTVPSLTTFYFPHENIVFSAYQLLEENLRGNRDHRRVVAGEAELVLRESTSRMSQYDTESKLPTSYGEAIQHVFSSFLRRK